nr:hypothetical protein [Tanacetum cinerariifolium]
LPVASASASAEGLIPPKTVEQNLARKNKLKAKSTLILAISDEHLMKFHARKDAKSLWEAIKNRFGGNNESKKMLKTILKQNYENFAASSQEGLDKTYDSALQLDNENLEQIDTDDLEEIDFKWQVAMITMRSFQAEEELTNYALMAYTSQGSSSLDSEVHTCSKECLKSYEALQKLYDQQREALNKSNLEIKDKTGLGYEGQMNESDLNDIHVNESEVLNNVFYSHKSDEDNNQVNDRFKKGEGYHAVPPPYTGNYMPSRAELSFVGLDNSIFKSKKSDSEDENVFKPKEIKKTIKTSLENIEFVNAKYTTVENENKTKKPRKFSQNPWGNKRNWNGLMTQKLGDGFEFKKKACFVCGSINQLIKDCDFYENKMVLNNNGKITGPKEIRPLWDNTARMNHQNKLTHPHPKRNFVPASVLTNSVQVPVNAAKQSSHRAAASVSAAMRVNTDASRLNVNNTLPITYSYFKAHSPVKRPFNKKSAAKTNNFNEKVNTAKVNNVTTDGPKAVVSAVEGNRNNDQGIFDSGCSRHMTENKSYLTDYQEIDGGFIAFRGKAKGGKITGKGALTYLFAKATLDESNLWHRRLGHINFKTMNKLLRGNLIRGRKPALSFMRPFGRLVTILNTLDHLGQAGKKIVPGPQYVLLPLLTSDSEGLKSSEDEVANDAGKKKKDLRDQEEALRKQCAQEFERLFGQGEAANTNNTNRLNIVSSPVNAVSSSFTTVDPGREIAQRNEFQSMFRQDRDANGNNTYRMFTHVSAAGSSYVNLGGSIPFNDATLPNADLPTDPLMPDLEDTADLQDTRIFSGAYDDEVDGVVADFNNLELTIVVSPIPTTRIHKDHPKEKIIGDPLSAPQTRRMTKTSQEHAMVYRNKNDERGTVVRNKARLVVQGYTQEEGIDYDEVFAPVSRIEAIRLFLAYASFIGFIVYQMDVKSAFLYGTIEEEVYVCQPPGFEDPNFPDKVYTVEKALYGLHKAPRAYDIIFGSTKKSLCTEFEELMHKKFQMSSMGELTFFLGLQVMQRDDGIFISHDKYVADILKKFDFSFVKTASTPIETNKALFKDKKAEDVNVHLYRSMIGSLMYLTASRTDIIYLKGQPKLGLWYLKDSPFDLEAFSDSDYAGASLDRKSITGGCQFLEKKLISWQCKKQTVVSNSTTEVEYVAAANCFVKVSTAEQKLTLNGCLDWNETAANDEIQVSAVGLTYCCEILNEEGVPTTSNDPLPSGVDRMQLNELMILCTNLQNQVLHLEEAKTAQAKEKASLKKKVEKLEQKRKSRTLRLKRLRKERMIDNIDQDVEITLVDDTQGRMNKEDMFGVNDLDGDEMVVNILASEKLDPSVKVVEKEVSTANPVTTAGEVVATADCKLAAILQEEERGELSIKEKSRLFVELMDKRKKHFARLKAEKIRSKPPNKDQKRNQMCTYLKNIENYKHNQLKNKSFKEIQMLFNNTMKWIEAFIHMVIKLVKDSKKAIEGSEKAEEGSSKRAAGKLEQGDAKRQRIE